MKKLICFFFFLFFQLLLNCGENIVEKVKEEFNKKNYENVINILEKEKNKYKQNPELYYFIGISYYNLKNTEKATSYLEDLIYKTDFEKPANIYDALRTLFEIYWRDKKIENVIKLGNHALKKFQDIINKSPGALQFIKYNLSRAYNEIGNNFFWSKNYQKAIENYTLSLSYNPQDYQIRERLGEAYYNTGEYDKSKEQFIEVFKNEKNNWYTIFLSISFYREISNKEERSLTLKSLPDDSLSFKIFKAFENFDSGMI